MELFTIGFPTAFSLQNLAFCFAGVFLGTLAGALPGIGALTAVTLLLPITFHLDPTAAIIMLAGVYYGTEYGGSTASILLNLPGTAANAVTCLDGYPMSQQGRAGVALFVTTAGSFVGGSIGILVLLAMAPLLVAFSLAFGPAEYFAIMVFGLLASATIAQGSPLKGIGMVVVGLLLGTVGIDINSGTYRFTFGFFDLFDGISLIVLAMGLFGVTEVMAAISEGDEGRNKKLNKVTLRSMIPTREDFRRSILPVLRGTGIGCLLGPLPGTGPTIASFISYSVEKRIAKDPSRFGKGAIEGIASPEASNNAAGQTAFVPTLLLGIPGSATMALMIGALMIHGISPGPRLMASHPEMFWGLIASFWIGNVLLVILNIPLIGIWVRLLSIPARMLYPVVVVLICLGTYTATNNLFDVWLLILFGVAGYLMRILKFEPAPVLVGFILGPMVEENLRRAMLLADGNFLEIVSRPLAGSIIAVTVVLAAVLLLLSIRKYYSERRAVPAE
jgi:TctA family transporter